MELLTQQEYQAIAKSIVLPTNAFIDGVYRPSHTKKTFTTYNPATKKPLCDVASCDRQDVDFAVEKARNVFENGTWSKCPPQERKETLIKFAKLLMRNHHELAVLESLDSGKTIFDCATIDIPETINCIKWHAESIDKIYDQVSPPSDEHIAMIVREPIGVVGLVLPWNFPLLMLAWKIAPALAAGCSVIVKPAEETSLTALKIAELATMAGLPRSVLNILPGTGERVGEPIGRHHDIDMVSFTGSTVTGKKFLRYSAESNAKEIVLEMGGKNPAIVMDDVENIDQVAQQIVHGAFWNMGENCSACSRLIVHESIKTPLLERMKNYMKHWNIGDPLNPETRIGAMVSQKHFQKVCSYLEKADHIYCGGHATDPFVDATIIEVNNPQDTLLHDEIFGPILSVISFSSFEEAIKIANETDYGLCASLFTSNVKHAMKGARAIKAGTVTVNCYGEGDITTPFGGFKQSGFGGRDNSLLAHDQYTQCKTIWIDLSDSHCEHID